MLTKPKQTGKKGKYGPENLKTFEIPGFSASKDTDLMGISPSNSTLKDLTTLLPRLMGKRILVVGDLMLDCFVSGEVLRISPESPVPVLSVRNTARMLGGAGNVLSNLCGLGVAPSVVALLGRDETAAIVQGLLQDLGCDVSGLIACDDRPTTVKTRFVSSGQHLLRVDEEDAKPASVALEADIIARAVAVLPSMDAVILSDYGKGVLTPNVLRTIIDAAKKHSIPVLVDPKGDDYGLYRGADVVTPNRRELSLATKMPTQSDSEIIAAGHAMLEKSGIAAVVATRSEDGMSVLHRGSNDVLHLRAHAREVFDVSGAGDTVIATVAAALAAGATLGDAALLANHAAGVVVGKIGTAPITRTELLASLQGEPADSVTVIPDATTPWEAAAAQVAQWKKLGLKVGFTNGCFDILHAGHVSYLQSARARCDKLVVGLNADESVRRLKGPARPVNDEESRARVLGALACVDLVVLFGKNLSEGDTPLEILHALTPNLLVKGADYTVDTVVGADYVISQGGEVWLAPIEEGKSTTGTIQKMKGVS
jgi:D-beta-D-heptose 7-phosphate kinase/D-beta-D-heptose 1-phosphate adenosyltransferase